MTYPCIDEDQFEMVDGTHIRPRAYMAFRHVATIEAAGIDRIYLPAGGNQAQDLYEVQVAWTNPDPVSHNVYALVTRGGSQVVATARNQVWIAQYMGTALGVAPADPVASTLISRFGTGGDMGNNGSQAGWSTFETRAGERTALLGSTVVVAPGETYKARVRLRFDGSVWESLPWIGGSGESELSISTGATRLDLYAYPVLS